MGCGRPTARRLAAWLLALVVGLALPTFLLLSDLEAVAYHLGAYRQNFVASGAARTTGLTEDQLVWTIRRTLDYATGRRADLQFDRAELDGGSPGRPAFQAVELEHMVDVRALFGLAGTVRWIALGLALAGTAGILALEGRRRGGRRLASGLIGGAAVFFLIWGVLAAAMVTGFSAFWTRFHEALFSNNLWQLPVNSLLIEMLPESLFERLALEIVGLLTLELVVILAGSACYLRRGARWS